MSRLWQKLFYWSSFLVLFPDIIDLFDKNSSVSSSTPIPLTILRLSTFLAKNNNTTTTFLSDGGNAESGHVIKLLWIGTVDTQGTNFYDFAQSAGAVNVALERFANENITFNNSQYDLEIAHAPMTGCSPYGALDFMNEIYFIQNYDFDAVIGPPCAEASLAVSTFAESRGRPHILWLGTHQDYDQKARYPHIVQTATDMGKVVECAIEMLYQLSNTSSKTPFAVESGKEVDSYRSWKRIAFISDSDSYVCNVLLWPTFKLHIEKKLGNTHDMYLSYSAIISGTKSSDEQIQQHLQEIRQVARVIMTCTAATGLLTPFGLPQKYDDFTLRILSQAHRAGMVFSNGDESNEFQWLPIVIQFSSHELPPYAPLNTGASYNFSAQTVIDDLKLPVSEAEFYEISRLIMIFDQDWGTSASKEFNTQVIEAAFQPPWNVNRTEFEQKRAVYKVLGRASVYAPHLADGIYLYGLAASQALASGADFRSASVMYDITRNVSFVGESGEFAVTSEGQRLTDVLLYAPVQPQTKYYQQPPLMRYAAVGVMRCASSPPAVRAAGLVVGKLDIFSPPFKWPTTHDGQPVRDTPLCGFFHENCQILSKTAVTLIACAGAMFLMAIFGLVWYILRRRNRMRALLNTDWNLHAQDFTWPQTPVAGAESIVTVQQRIYNRRASHGPSIHSDVDGGSFTSSIGTTKQLAQSRSTLRPSTAATNVVADGGGAGNSLTALYKQKLRVHVKLLEILRRTSSSSSSSAKSGAAAPATGNFTTTKVIHVENLSLACYRELRAMKDLDHDNVNRFVGILFEMTAIGEAIEFFEKSPNAEYAFLVATSNCSKGSLDNILYGNDGGQQQQQLDWLFKYSFMCDIAAGLAYLHAASALKWHGRLRTRAVLLDARWTCKLADYGLWSFHDGSTTTDMSSQKQQEKLLWTAPEVLRAPPSQATSTAGVAAADVVSARQAADVYSFGVVLSEIIYQVAPYEAEQYVLGYSISRIVAKLKRLDDDGTADILRPEHTDFSDKLEDAEKQQDESLQFTNTAAAAITNTRNNINGAANKKLLAQMQAARQLMLDCWQESPTSRPNVKNIVRRLRQLSGRSNNSEQSIVDRVIAKLETYAENLEGIVRERTGELLEEQARADALLSRMLPASVARALKHGEPVVPEQYDEATVFFSDVVSFTTIASCATPMQVVQLLNDLYTFMDTTLDVFAPNVYKVETIGDAYMVVSGIPLRTPNHARIMASMALAILANITRVVRVPLLQCSDALDAVPPPKSVQLRVGLNSGACVAGVVGLAMPRYCLFGDTVNVASRMESNSEAMRVHISASTREALGEWPEYACLDRGVVNIKGKGEMHTFWLVHGPHSIDL